MIATIGGLRASRLLIGLRIRQQLNRTVSVIRHRWGSKTRQGTARKGRAGWLIGLWIGVSMMIAVAQISYSSVTNVERVIRAAEVHALSQSAPSVRNSPGGAVGVRGAAPRAGRPTDAMRTLAPAPGSVWPAAVTRGETFLVSMTILAALLLTLASREIVRPEWELEWLVTLPMSGTTLIACRIVERALTNFSAMIVMAPIIGVMAWRCGHHWTAPLYAVGLTIPLVFFVATVHTLVDTGLRLSLAPSRLRNLHAMVSILSSLPLLLVVSMSVSDTPFVIDWAAKTPDWALWLPGGLMAGGLAAADGGVAAQWLALGAGELLALCAAGFLLLRRQVRRGVVAASVREAAVRRPAMPHALGRGDLATRLFSAVQRRELRLLGRDRSFMSQTLMLPLIVVGAQVFLNSHIAVFANAVANPSTVAAVAFGLAAYTLLYSAFQTLNTEGQALWILYCVPRSLESVLGEKARLWAGLAMIYPLVIFAAAVWLARDISLPFAGAAFVVLAGVPIFSMIATALGVFGCDPLEQDVQKRVRISYLYIYMTLASFYAYAIYASTIWQRAATMVLTALVAFALWQRARDRVPYLLDPSAMPPARVSISDGLFAALMFFVLQSLIGVLALTDANPRTLTASMVWVAYTGAAAITYVVMRTIYWRAGTAEVPRVLGPGLARSALLGVGGGVAAAAFGLAYVTAARAYGWFPEVFRQAHTLDVPTILWLGALAVIAAPIFEEFIFRGLIFGGLRRSLGVGTAALASAAIFAIVHPPASVVPVFVLGVCTALVYARTRMLAASMIVHALYNAVVLAFQWQPM